MLISINKFSLRRAGEYQDGWPCLGSIPGTEHLLQSVTSHPGQLNIAILSWVGTMSTSQRAIMPCGWGVKAGMICVCGSIKLCDPLVTHGPYMSTLQIGHNKKENITKHYINSPPWLLLYHRQDHILPDFCLIIFKLPDFSKLVAIIIQQMNNQENETAYVGEHLDQRPCHCCICVRIKEASWAANVAAAAGAPNAVHIVLNTAWHFIDDDVV